MIPENIKSSANRFESTPIWLFLAKSMPTEELDRVVSEDVGAEVEFAGIELPDAVFVVGSTGREVSFLVGESEPELDHLEQVIRMMQRRRSGIDGRTLARILGCNKQGFSPNNHTTNPDFGTEKRLRCSAREGCKATILVKIEKSGKWVVTRFVKEHNHSLVLTASPYDSLAGKDKNIKELT